MGTTAQKLQKLVENKQLIVDSVNAKAGTTFTINSKPSDIANAISDITSGGGIPEGYIKPSGNKEITSNGDYNITEFASVSVNVPTTGGSAGATAVPNTGYVEKVYFNTSLSVDEVVNLLSKLTYTNSEFAPMPAYGLINKHYWVNNEWVDLVLAVFKFDDLNYGIMDFDNGIVYFSTTIMPDSPFTFVGWKTDFNGEIVIEGDVENQLQDIPFGLENDKLTDLFSATPFGGSSCEPTGLPIEVDSLPIKKGTAIPIDGYVENIYFNTDLNNEKIVELCSSLEYASLSVLGLSYDASLIYANADTAEVLAIVKTEDSYNICIVNMSSAELETTNLWYPLTTGYQWSEDLVNPWVANGDNAVSFLASNLNLTIANSEVLTELFSTTPFESDGVEDAVYKTPRKFTDVYIYVDDFTYGNLSEMYLVLGSEEVETKPTSNIISSTMESFYLYYVKSENDIFVYIDVGYGPMWVNVSMMTELVYGAALPFKGECEKGDEPTDIGYYAYFIPEYLYQVKDSQLQELKYKPKKIEISPGGVEETFKPLKGEYFSEVKLTAGDYITPYKIHHRYTILGVKGACVPIEDFFRSLTFDKIELEDVSLEDKMFYRKSINEIKIKVATSYSSTNSCFLGERAFSYCEANKIILKGDYILIFSATIRSGYDKNGNFAEVYNKHQGFSGCSKLTTLVLDFPDFAPITSTNYPDFAVDLFRNTPIANGTGYIYVPDNKVDYVKKLAGYDQVASQIRPLSAYTE